MKETYVGNCTINGLNVAAVYRAEYLHAIEMACATDDPCRDWEGFVEALWSALVPALGLNVEVLDASEHNQRLGELQGPSD